MKKSNNSSDALLLSGIRMMTILINIVSSATLSRMLALDTYGTYSAGNLIVSVATNLSILGMMDAANYFYHQEGLSRRDCINTIYFLQLLIGLGCGAVILAGSGLITAYFDNPMLKGIYLYIAFRPLLDNIAASLLTLQMSIGKARAVGVRNACFALGKLGAVLLTGFFTGDIRTVFTAYMLLEGATVVYYYLNFKKAAFAINPLAFRKELIAPILKFAVPMGIYVMTNTLSRDLDKLVIGHYESTSQLAVYSNCATLLPFSIISSAFLTIIMPIMTRLIQRDEMERAGKLFRNYLSIGFLSTFIFTVTCIVLAEEVIHLLYGEKYLSGKLIFILYTIVDMVKFASISLVLSARGKTGVLMGISAGMLVVNGVLNLVLYRWMGVPGPAVATVITALATTWILLSGSARILRTGVRDLIDLPLLGRTCAMLAVAAAVGSWLRGLLQAMGVHYLLILVCVGGLMCGTMLLANFRKIKTLFRGLNSERIEN